jgi:hypothetical protein
MIIDSNIKENTIHNMKKKQKNKKTIIKISKQKMNLTC